MNAQAAPPQLVDAASPEDRARADFYALIARLFYAGPDSALLAAIATADQIAGDRADPALVRSWSALVAAAATLDTAAAREEYDSLFVGTGKAEITLYASNYLAESMKENVLVRLRTELAAMGLARDPGAAEAEDHLSGLCEVMRHLACAGSDDVAVQKQKKFFLEYLGPWYDSFCDSVIMSVNADFYKRVAEFARAFMQMETESFEIAR